MRLTDRQIRDAARIRIDLAMMAVEAAQNQLARACAQLSAIRGGVQLWRQAHRLHDTTQEFWHRLDSFRSSGRYGLDPVNVAALERALEGDQAPSRPGQPAA